MRGCGHAHPGACWTERAQRWLTPGTWVPPEYRHLTRRDIEDRSNDEINAEGDTPMTHPRARAAAGIHDHPRYKLGLIPPDPAQVAAMLRFRLTAPAYAPQADWMTAVPPACWNGDTNTRFGTCFECALANLAVIQWWWCAGEAITVSDAAIYDLYRRSGNPQFNPDAPPGPGGTVPGDNGTDPVKGLAAVKAGGIEITHADGTTETVTPVCYGTVTDQEAADLRAVTGIFGAALCCVSLQQAQQAQTDTGGPWDYVPGSPPWGGHAVGGGAYTSGTLAGQADESVETWQMRVGMTDTFWARQAAGLFTVVYPPLYAHPAFQQGVDQAALAADYQALTGQPLPAPGPAPSPGPGPVDGSPFVAAWGAGTLTGLQAWCRGVRTRPDLARVKSELQGAAQAMGLPL